MLSELLVSFLLDFPVMGVDGVSVVCVVFIVDVPSLAVACGDVDGRLVVVFSGVSNVVCSSVGVSVVMMIEVATGVNSSVVVFAIVVIEWVVFVVVSDIVVVSTKTVVSDNVVEAGIIVDGLIGAVKMIIWNPVNYMELMGAISYFFSHHTVIAKICYS